MPPIRNILKQIELFVCAVLENDIQIILKVMLRIIKTIKHDERHAPRVCHTSSYHHARIGPTIGPRLRLRRTYSNNPIYFLVRCADRAHMKTSTSISLFCVPTHTFHP